MLKDKDAASDALYIITYLKARNWTEERIRAAIAAISESYVIVDESKAQRIKH